MATNDQNRYWEGQDSKEFAEKGKFLWNRSEVKIMGITQKALCRSLRKKQCGWKFSSFFTFQEEEEESSLCHLRIAKSGSIVKDDNAQSFGHT